MVKLTMVYDTTNVKMKFYASSLMDIAQNLKSSQEVIENIAVAL